MRSAAAIAALFALVARAGAEPARDFDADTEERSEFWERALEPEKARYDDLIERAVAQMREKDKSARDTAAAILRDAIRLAPDRAMGHMWLGRLESEQGKFAACARSIAKALEVEPDFQPPLVSEPIPPEWAGAFELAVCRAQAGDYENAVDGLRRILASGASGQGVALVHLRLGESYMALGRLDEALAALQQAVRMSPYDNRDMSFALAVAFDRDEDSAQSRDTLTKALERDPRMGDLLRPSRVWIPVEDSHYYLGFGYLGGADAPRALYHFRRYLAVAGSGMWAGRARGHLEAAQSGAVAGRDLQIRGSATLDQAKTATAIGKLDGELQSCVAKTPDLLLRVSLTRVVPGADATEGSRQAGARVLVSEQGGLKSEVLRGATSCVETAAAKIATPKPAGAAGAYVVAEFSVIRR